MTVRTLALVLLAALSPAAPARAAVTLPPVLSSHMVLQRDRPVPIWGKAAPGEKISVTFRGQTTATEADKDGKWMVRLDALKAGGPDRLVVQGTNSITLEDVLVGEVWLGSGQSNMAGRAAGYAKGDPLLAKAIEAGPYTQLRLITSGGKWQVATPASAANFSALMFSFGLKLHQELKVPVGLMVGAVGGTPSGMWLTEGMVRQDAACRKAIAADARANPLETRKAQYEKALEKWKERAKQAEKEEKKAPPKPAAPVEAGQATRGKIGQLYQAHIQPFVPFAIRGVLWDQGESGTAVQGIDQYTLMGALIRGWRGEWGQGDFPFLYVQKPSGGGCAWDLDDPITSKAEKFAALPAAPPAGPSPMREQFLRIRGYPSVGLVIASDLGSGVHPTNKFGYGTRAALVALGMVYGRKVEYYGPVYARHVVEGGRVRVHFTHTGKGLARKHGEKLQGFAIAGADKTFHWAEAKVEGDTVVVSSPMVKAPMAVRYAWAPMYPWANLFNRDGLPALPFRTDDW